ncbi:hypothetical protein ABEB36_011268 [Hypothenemus hampei]|uniref:Nuclear pore complex protein Nup205 n=1 Tax=Hypothenemus hampei TaxID=57062 RepID=A0ABD1EGU6_HYPHA
MAPILVEDVWNSYKDLKDTVWKYLHQSPESDLPAADFENILKKHKQTFFLLLQNPAKNPKKREELRNGMVEGINVRAMGHQLLSLELYEETVIFSDMFDLNELIALDLLCTAQLQMPYFPGLSRGLVAVLIYYDSRKALLTTLLYLVQARHGVQWTVNIKPDISRFLTEYTDQLMDAGIFKRILDLIASIDITSEFEKLQSSLEIDDPKHRREVTDLINDIRRLLAEIVFSWASQCGFPKDYTLTLLDFLRRANVESEATGIIDDVTLFLEMTLLSCIDLSIFHTREDGEEVVQTLPILSDTSLIPAILSELIPSSPAWACEGLHALTNFGMSVCLASLKVLQQNYIFQDSMNKEDLLIDSAIENNVFSFLQNVILDSKLLYKEKYLYKRMHNLLTDFIVHMYPKVKDLRMKANEVARTLQVYIREGLEAPPSLPRYFESLLLVIGKFYSNMNADSESILSWWSPTEINPNQKPNTQISPRSVALFKFVKLAGDMLPVTLFVPFITMLKGLSSCHDSARLCFSLLKQPGLHLPRSISWEHFFMSFGQYYHNLRHEAAPPADTVYRIKSGYHKGISVEEQEGLHAVLLLIQTVAEKDSFARLALCEHPGWCPLSTFLGLVTCSIPIYLKAHLLQTLAVLSRSTRTANVSWQNLESSQILVTVPTTAIYAPRGIQTELDEIESRMEEYPVTRGVLQLLDSLTQIGVPKTLGAGHRSAGFDPYLSFIINNVFLKYSTRLYKDPTEKLDIALLCLRIFERFLRRYDPKVTDFPGQKSTEQNSPPGYHLMVLLNNKSDVLGTILDLIEEGTHYFDFYVTFPGQEKIQEYTLLSLNIIHRVLGLQQKFFSTLAQTYATIPMTNLSKLLLSINRRTGRSDHCINIAKYISYHSNMPKHSLVAVKILSHITSSVSTHNLLMNAIWTSGEEQNLIKNAFFQCLDSTIDDVTVDAIKMEILRLLTLCLNYSDTNLTHFLMGFDLASEVSLTEFHHPGVMDSPRTCFHSLFSIMDAAVSRTTDRPKAFILEFAYQLLYRLASNVKTSGPVLRFLRLNKLFFCVHLKECQKNMKEDYQVLKQMSWLMKTLAVELKSAGNANQVSYLKYLVNFLVNVPATDEGHDSFFLHQILQIELSDLKNVPEITEFQVPTRINEQQLNQLMEEHTLKMKKHQEACNAVVEFVDSWRQVAEVLATFIPLDVFYAREQQVYNITLLLCVLKKVVRAGNLLPEIPRLLSGSVVLMMTSIKENYIKERRTFNSLSYYLGSLKEILQTLVQWIITSNVVDGELRMNLYAGLVIFLQLTTATFKGQSDISSEKNMNTSRLNELGINMDPINNEILLSIDIIGNFGEKLMEVLCHDCLGGQEVSKILAMAIFSQLATLTGDENWIRFLSNRGFFKYIVQSISDSNDELKELLEPGCDNGKTIGLYLSKMLMFIRLAGTVQGSQMILDEKLLGVFSSMNLYDCHPEMSKHWQSRGTVEGYLLTIEQQYMQFFIPVLHICNALLTTLGTENQNLTEQIMQFLISHLDIVELILRSGHTELSETSLKELSLLTLVISRTANNNLINVLENPNVLSSNRAKLHRIQRLMLNLSQKFLLSEENINCLISATENEESNFQTSNRLLYAMEIAVNLLCYARNIIANNDVEHGEVGVIYYPSFYDPTLHPFESHSTKYTSNEQEPTLGVIVQQLLYAVSYHQKVKISYDKLQKKIQEVPDMNTMDLEPFTEDHMELFELAVQKEKANLLVEEKLVQKNTELDHCAFIIENSLYIIWAHLDYFMLRAIPNPRSSTFIHPNPNPSTIDVSLPAPSNAICKVSTEVINSLKQGMMSLLNDSFSNQILQTIDNRSEADIAFVDALLRKIKRLIQFVRPF